MKIHFKTDSIRKVCENVKVARRKYGSTCAKSLHSRIEDIRAANCVGDLRAGRPHPLTGKRKGQMAVRLDKKFRLVFTTHQQQTTTDVVDWTKVDEVLLIEITNYHD